MATRASTAKEYGKKLGFGQQPALFISDMQNAYTDANYPRGLGVNAIIKDINRLIEHCRKQNIPIFYSVIAFSDAELNKANFWLKKIPGLTDLKQGSPLVDVNPQIQINTKDHLIRKNYPSPFFGTHFLELLQSQKIDTLLITGCTTSGCVHASAIDAMQYGFRPIIIKELVADRWQESHDNALYELNAKYADVLTLQDCITYIDQLRR